MLPVTRFWSYLSQILGITYVLAWSISFYPQPIHNFRRKSTAGTSPLFPLFNVLGFSCYLISQLSFFCSSLIQDQYRQRYGSDNTVRWNDLLFAIHAMVLCTLTFSQFWSRLWGFQQRRWRVGPTSSGLVAGSIFAIGFYIVAILVWGEEGGRDATGWAWIDCVDALGYIKLFVTVIKYIPQVWENFKEQSTVGWNIYQVLLDLFGGILSIAQLVIDSNLRGGDFRGVLGNPIKFGLGNISILFDLIFMFQHYVLYKGKRKEMPEDKLSGSEVETLLSRADSVDAS